MHQVKQFLSLHWDKKSPLLLALSGGPDSKALLYLLLEQNVKPHVAHVDHGWRKESGEEAQALKKEINSLGLSFHLLKLEKTEKKENEARIARYEELLSLAQKIGAQAVLLAHQMEDQAETVLKRIFEGAALPMCQGMQAVSNREGVALWRPLLEVSKKKLLAYLDENNISYFTDPTNLDPKYLRGRLRTQIFPFLEEAFGKSIVKNLCLLSKRAGELKAHLDHQTQDVVLEHLLSTLLRKKGALNREQLSQLLQKLKK